MIDVLVGIGEPIQFFYSINGGSSWQDLTTSPILAGNTTMLIAAIAAVIAVALGIVTARRKSHK